MYVKHGCTKIQDQDPCSKEQPRSMAGSGSICFGFAASGNLWHNIGALIIGVGVPSNLKGYYQGSIRASI